MNICVIGTGFVGVVSAAVYASFGHDVIGLDVDKNKIKKLSKGQVPFFEPNLEPLVNEQLKLKHLSFSCNYKKAVSNADVVILAVGTPSAKDGQADLKYIVASTESLAPYIKNNSIISIKSTVPPGTLNIVSKIIKNKTKKKFFTASLPEFLREGSAVHDTLNPDRVVIGCTNQRVFEKLELLHKPFNAPIIKVKPESAQMGKYTANSYLATRITFINQIADLCEKNKADISEVIETIGYDKRIGKHYWYPGLGYGGSCFPKDVKELAAYSRAVGASDNILNKITDINEQRIKKLLESFDKKIGGWKEKTVAILGLSFKPNTDDMREAPSTKIIPWLLKQGSKIRSFDPMANWSEYEQQINKTYSNHSQFSKIVSAIKNADVIICLVEWPQIISFDFAEHKHKKNKWFIDARNQFKPTYIKKSGYKYIGIGR